MKTLILVFTLLTLGLVSYGQADSMESEEWKNYDVMAEYLSRGSGKWIGDNPNYDPQNEHSPKAFGLWFERPLPSLMTLIIVAYMEDTVLISSQGTFNWHPSEQQFIHSMSDRGNGYSEGITYFPSDTTFISEMLIYRPDGKVYDHKDENFVVSENIHRNTSYGKDENGNWVERGSWVWRRE